MLVLGERLAAPDAVAAGLINVAVSEADLDAEVERVAERLSAAPTFAIGLTKQLLASSGTRPIEAQMAQEVRAFARCAVSDDFAEGVKAFTEKRRAVFSGR
jgi:2-(1,2-epoxy-1,2-dihydrophenyl)acetyl-CoA isomerase